MKSHNARFETGKNSESLPMNAVTRKEFIEKAIFTGTMLAMPAFITGCASVSQRLADAGPKDALWRDYPIASAASIAVTAPNPHNSQAWKVRFDSPEALTLYVDESRLLPDTDPPARQIHIGHGTFLELLRMAAAANGFDCDIKLFPQGTYSLAEIGKKPVASVRLSAKSEIPTDATFSHWQARMTDRTEFAGPAIAANEFATLAQLTAATGSTLSFIGEGPLLKNTADMIYRAMELEMHDTRCADETFRWFRLSDADIAMKADGLNLRGNGLSGFKLWFVRTFVVSADKISFQSKSNSDAYLESFRKVADSSRGLALFTTASNGMTDWVNTGRDYMRFQLAVTSLGLAMQPVSQVLQEYPGMQILRKRFEDDMQIKPPGKIQMLVRLGRSDYKYFAPRRPVKDLLL